MCFIVRQIFTSHFSSFLGFGNKHISIKLDEEYNLTFINKKNYDKEDGIFIQKNFIPHKHTPVYLFKYNINEILRFGVFGRLWDKFTIGTEIDPNKKFKNFLGPLSQI